MQTGVNSFDAVMVSGNSAAINADTLIFNIMIAIQTKRKALIVMIPFLTAGMSLAGFTLPFLYIIYSMIYTLENEKGRLM